MMAFDHVFMDVARRDSWAIQTADHVGTQATFLFREFYCAEPGCDCRRVMFLVHWIEGKRVAASINYAFEPPRRRDEPQIALDPLNPQSEHSERLLAWLTERIAEDREYRGRLLRHYRMWKQVVDDPAHPDHAKVRAEDHDAPAVPRRKPRAPRQRRRVEAASNGMELVAAKIPHASGKLQQRFRRLLQKVEGLRRRVRAWKEERPAIDREIAAYSVLVDQQCKLGRDMVASLDRSYENPRFSKADRKKLAALICTIAGDLVEQGGHDDLKPLYNRYSRSDFDAEAAAADTASVAAVKSMLEVFGVELGDAEVGSIEELEAFALRAAEQEEAAAEARRAKRKKSAKQIAADAKRDADRRNANKAVQDVYRALAMALHPDREQDPHERARKTELMREVNVAYEAKDLLRLLELQLKLEQVETARIDALAEERVLHYNRLLDEQAKQLAVELDELEFPFRMQLEVSPPARLGPVDVVARIRVDADAMKRQIAALVHDLEVFEDVTKLKSWLKMQGRRRREHDLAADLFG